jgi:predicted nucleic acid-binding protein
MQAPRIYVDTSVFGGCFDPEYEAESKCLFELVRNGRITALVSDIVTRELDAAPENVREVFASLPSHRCRRVPVDAEAERLARAYVTSGVLPQRSWNDAEHVASASRARANAIASWNFRDIVSAERIRGFNAMNLTLGYGLLVILSPHGISRATEDKQP